MKSWDAKLKGLENKGSQLPKGMLMMNANKSFNKVKMCLRITAMLMSMLILLASNTFATELETSSSNSVGATYRTHIQNEGWAQGWMSNAALSGSEGKGYRLEGIEIKLIGNNPADLGIEYRTHVQNIGWEQKWAVNGGFSGSEGKGLRLEGVQIRLTGTRAADYSVKYRTHIQNEGWAQGWVYDGALSGSEGKSLRLEAIEIVIETKTTATTPPPAAPVPEGKNVRDYGATGNGSTNDTAAIQTALNENTTVYIPDGTYMINVDQPLKPRSNQTITLSSNAVLKALPSANGYNAVVRMSGVSQVNISGGKIVGERYEHKGSSGEWGMGIHVIQGSNNISISNMTISDCWGDGIFLGDSPYVSDITIDNVISDNNRRQGLSITDAKRVIVKNSVFKNTNGTLPEAGIDIEPDANQTAEDIKIINTQMVGNRGSGLDLWGINGVIQNVEVVGSTMRDNSNMGIRLIKASHLTFDSNTVINNLYGIELEKDVYNASFKNMTISKNKSRGISLVTSGQAQGVEKIVFENSLIANNSQGQPGAADGVRIDTWDSTGFIRDVKFLNCRFIDDQAQKTQGYGLTIATNSRISGVAYNSGCSFTGNIYGNMVADSLTLQRI